MIIVKRGVLHAEEVGMVSSGSRTADLLNL
jgi:hypothetical protein